MYVWKSRCCFEQFFTQVYPCFSWMYLKNMHIVPKRENPKTVSVNKMRNQPAQLYNRFLHKLNSQYTSTPKYISINL